MVKVGIIGGGWIGASAQLDLLRPVPASHAQAIETHPDLDLIGIVDNHKDSIKAIRHLYPDLPTYSKAEALFKANKPDVVVIATHPDTHCQFVNLCIDHQIKAILCEKPLSHELAEAKKTVKRCKDTKTILVVNHMRRYDPLLNQIKSYINNDFVRDTAIGAIHSGTADYDYGIYHGGTHIIDLLIHLLGPVQQVSAIPNHQSKWPKDDFLADGFLVFNSCQIGLHYSSSDHYSLGEVNLYGSLGRLNLKHMWGQTVEIIGTGSSPNYSAYRELDYTTTRSFGEARSFLTGTYNHLVDCLNKKSTSWGEVCLDSLRVIKALEKSTQKGGKLTEVK